MIRAAILFLAIVAVAVAGAWYADNPGTVMVNWSGWRIEASLAVIALVLLFAAIILLALYKIMRWLLAGPGAWSKARQERKRQQGYQALSRGLVAVAAGDGKEAKRLAKRTEVLLNDPPLTLLLSAQAAQIDGDDAEALRHFRAMCERPETEFLGIRGLLSHARRNNNSVQALELARRAYELRPDTPWVLRELFTLETEHLQWDKAAKLLDYGERKNTVGKGEARQRRALLLFAQALAAENQGESGQAQTLAVKANSLAPDFAPAAALAVKLLVGAGQNRKAGKLLQNAWRTNPHPDLADTALAIYAAEPGKIEAQKLNSLVSGQESETQSRLLLARAALVDNNFALARNQLKPLLNDTVIRSVCQLMADLADRDFNDAAEMRQWLERAANAPADSWRCDDCSERHPDWQANCRDCGSFGSLQWQQASATVATDLSELPVEIVDTEMPAVAVIEPKKSEPAVQSLTGSAGVDEIGTVNAATNDTAMAADKNIKTQNQPQ